METKKPPRFVFSIIAIIVGVALFRLVDFKNFHVEKPALAFIYLICFLFSLWIIFKKPKTTKGD